MKPSELFYPLSCARLLKVILSLANNFLHSVVDNQPHGDLKQWCKWDLSKASCISHTYMHHSVMQINLLIPSNQGGKTVTQGDAWKVHMALKLGLWLICKAKPLWRKYSSYDCSQSTAARSYHLSPSHGQFLSSTGKTFHVSPPLQIQVNIQLHGFFSLVWGKILKQGRKEKLRVSGLKKDLNTYGVMSKCK